MSSPRVAAPPRFPRALFIAAFAVAGSMVVRVRAPAIAALTPSREERRDRSVGHIARQLGRSIIAAERASVAFFKRGTAYAPPEKRRIVDAAALAVIGSSAVADLIGKPGLDPSLDAPWIEVDREAVTPCVRVFWRGELMPGEKLPRVWEKTGTGQRVAIGSGQTTDSTRDCDPARFAEAVEAAKQAMRKHGVRLSSFTEIRRLKTPALNGADAFEGLIATVGLARKANPLRINTLVR